VQVKVGSRGQKNHLCLGGVYKWVGGKNGFVVKQGGGQKVKEVEDEVVRGGGEWSIRLKKTCSPWNEGNNRKHSPKRTRKHLVGKKGQLWGDPAEQKTKHGRLRGKKETKNHDEHSNGNNEGKTRGKNGGGVGATTKPNGKGEPGVSDQVGWGTYLNGCGLKGL